jgi:hypothetical protein
MNRGCGRGDLVEKVVHKAGDVFTGDCSDGYGAVMFHEPGLKASNGLAVELDGSSTASLLAARV